MSDKIIEEARQKIVELNKVINERTNELEEEKIKRIKSLEWTVDEIVYLSTHDFLSAGTPLYKLTLQQPRFNLKQSCEITLIDDLSDSLSDINFYSLDTYPYQEYIGTSNMDNFIEFLSKHKFKDIRYNRYTAKLYKLIGELYPCA